MDQMIGIAEDADATITDAANQLQAMARDHQSVTYAYKARRDRYLSTIGVFEQSANDLLVAYREANVIARKTAPPAHFQGKWQLPDEYRSVADVVPTTDADLAEQVKKAQRAIEELHRRIRAERERISRALGEIEELAQLGEDRHGEEGSAALGRT
jgi:hypothetical protein